ncbi:hypothetical protein M5K25_013911 [Dendrobium thyrsiflorum]|uniref:Protein EMBRYONIC FLOWER 1 n=1 Tax=Dendrobium thyrsiflorum TaxID=117978 RepID=A0ABD0UV14_DENTH
MAVSFVEEPHCRFEKTALISDSKHSPAASKTTEIIEADDDKEPNECKHFTIRGYVAEVRKRDSKNCWPFLFHNHASLETSNVCPPLPVAKFRWWGCQNCVCEIIATTTQMTTGGAMSIQNQDVKSNNNSLLGKDTETSQFDARKVLSKLPQISKENNQKEVLKMNDCLVKIKRVGKEENGCLPRELIEEGFQKCKDGQDSQNEIQNVVSDANCVSNGCTDSSKRKRGEYRNPFGRKKLGVAYLKDALGTALVKCKGSKLSKIGHSKMLGGDATSIRIKFALRRSKEYTGPERRRADKRRRNDAMKVKGHTKVDMVVRKDDVLDADPVHTLRLGACFQDKRTCGASVDGSKFMGLTDDKHQIKNNVEHTNGKKIRKVRFLEDIIRSEKQYVIGNTLDRDAKTIQHDFIGRRVTSKEKVLLLNDTSIGACQNNASKIFRGKSKIQNSVEEDEDEDDAVTCIDRINHFVCQRNKLKSIKRKDIHENLFDEDEGPFLMHWLKNMPKKANAYDREANAKHNNGNLILSKFSADLSSRRDRDVDARDCVVRVHKQKSAFNQKHTLSPEDGHRTSGILIGDEMKSKNFSSQDISKKNSIITEKTQHFSKETSHGAGGNAILHSIRNKMLLNDRIGPCQTKDSSSTQKKASLEVWKKASKKTRNRRTTDQEALDDIPMDIVELLARNQHDRHHVVAETDSTNKVKFPAMTESIKYTCGFDPSQINKNNASDAEQGNLSCQKFQVNNKGFDVWTTFPCNGEMEHEPKVCGCSINGKKKLQIDLNQRCSDSLISGAGSCNLETNGNFHQLNFSCCRSNNMYSSQSFLEDQRDVCENLSGYPHHEMLQHINGASYGLRNHFINNLNGSGLGRDLKMFTHSDDYEKPRNVVGKHHHWGFSPAAPNASSFMDLANAYHSNFCPADLYSNETISALNLLRLMDQAAWSGEPRHHFQSCSGFIKETDLSVDGQYNEPQLEYGSREKEPCICPLEVVNPSTCQPRNSCLLFRPLPRIGILGPSLHKEIFNFSNYSKIPTKSSYGFLKTDVNEKIEPSCLNPKTSPWNSHNSLFRCKCSEKISPDRDPDGCHDSCATSNTRFSLVRSGATRVELNNKVDALLPLGFCKMEICVLNRNPADFTVLDETNEYMIEIKELKLKSVPPSESLRGPAHGQKKQRVMKLNDLKAFAMG